MTPLPPRQMEECRPEDVTDLDSLYKHCRSLLGHGDGAEEHWQTMKATIHRLNRYGLISFDTRPAARVGDSQALAAPGWRPISTVFASDESYPLLAKIVGKVIVWVHRGSWDDEKKGWFDSFYQLEEPTHWLKLPDAPKGDSRE